MRLAPFAWIAVLALVAPTLAPCPAHARVGDVVALVAAGAVTPAPVPANSARVAGHDRVMPASAPLSTALLDLGLDQAEALGPAIAPDGGGATRLVLFSSSQGALAPAAAVDAARALVERGAALSAMADRELTLADTVPNDTFVVDQWYLGATGGGVHVTQAWDITTGSPSVVIGVLDTGVDTGHPDLASKIWTNPGEIPGNGIDDDGDGYIDDVHGWDFGDHDNDPNPTPLIDSDGLDEGFHGTAVAGAAAAATNNTEGIAGVGWQSTVMPLKFSDTAGHTDASAAGEGMLYAIAHHVGVLNMSFGASASDSATTAFFQALVNQANAANVLCVCAAGNEGSSVPSAPAGCTGVLSVGSTAATNTRSSFSNYGPWVNIAAPGEDIWAPISRNYVLDPTSDFIYGFFFGYDDVHPYMFSSGTSLSTPIVSGACALVRAKFPTAHPAGIIQHMIDTGDHITFDQPIGPKLNVYQALAVTLGVGDLPAGGGARTLQMAGARPTPFAGRTSVSFTLARALDVDLVIVDVTGRAVRTLLSGAQSAGPHAVAWDGADDAGRRAPAGLYFAVLRGAGERAVTRLVRID